MQKIAMALVAVIAVSFQSQAHAGAQCVPTQTVEQAQAQYDASVVEIGAALSQAYLKAASNLDQANAQSLAAHNNRVKDIDAKYALEVQVIRANLNLGWREELTAAAERHNQGLKASADQYTFETQGHAIDYNQAVQQAQAHYNTEAQAIADRYNKAVCAQ